MKLRTRSDVVHSLQSNAEMLMGYRDLDPDSAMADDATLISQGSQDISHQEDSQDVMPAAKKLKVTRNLLWIYFVGSRGKWRGECQPCR